MAIFYVHSPAFAVELERLRNPRLLRRPVVVAAQVAPRAPILSVSPEAYALGARKGAKLAEVRKLDRRIRILAADYRLYRKAQEKLGEVVERFTPRYEVARPGSFFLDMDGTERLFGKALDAAAKIQSEVARVLGLASTIGTARNKLVSRIAAKVVRPKGLCDIFPGGEAAFLAPLELSYLPALREVAHPELFRELAIRRIGELKEIPAWLLVHVFGRPGEALQRQAVGIDEDAVAGPETEVGLRREILLSPESNDDAILFARLWKAIEQLGAQLRERGMMAGEMRLEAVSSDRQRIQKIWAISPPTHLDFSLFSLLRTQWPTFTKRRVSLKSIDLILTRLGPAFRQLGLGADERELRLCETLDRLRKKYGPEVLWTGSSRR